ncbi:MAG: sulfatase family protein [Bacteroidales bacterium]
MKNLRCPICFCSLLFLLNGLFFSCRSHENGDEIRRPNILFAIADDQSWPYASVYDSCNIKTPIFNRVAKEGILFRNAFVAAPQCSPSRAAILTGRYIWQLEEAGTHASYFPKKFQVFTDLLENSGYELGFTGKPWGPGNWKDAGWARNPVGPEFNDREFDSVPASGIHLTDYVENFKEFYRQKDTDKPFFFWYGCFEPHRPYEEGSGLKAGMEETDARVPDFLPDHPLVRSDILDHSYEIEWFDRQLGGILKFLEEKGELENTLIIVTADNGMPFPSAKANLMEYGTHVPLAIRWPAGIKGNRVTEDLVSLTDIAPTLMDIAGVEERPQMTGRSFYGLLLDNDQSAGYVPRDHILTGRERHTHARPDNLGYPARAIRTAEYLYIWNLKPERWPAGNPMPPGTVKGKVPEGFMEIWPGYNDVDDSPTKLFLIDHQETYPLLFDMAYARRPGEQLYDIRKDPACTVNVAEEAEYAQIRADLRKTLEEELREQGDPRMLGYGDIFESYPRISPMRLFPGFKKQGEYNPEYLVEGQVRIK